MIASQRIANGPADLAESFAGQMERTMLLDHQQPVASRTNRLPQYALLAAIVALVLGLGTLLAILVRGSSSNYAVNSSVKVLSSPHFNPAPGKGVELTSPPSQMDADKSLTKMAVPSATKADRESPVLAVPTPSADTPLASARSGQSPAVPLSITAAADKPAAGADVLPAPVIAAIPSGVSANAPRPQDVQAIESLRGRLLENRLILSEDRRTIALIVTSTDPAATAKKVNAFFTRGQLAFNDNQPPDTSAILLAKANSAMATNAAPHDEIAQHFQAVAQNTEAAAQELTQSTSRSSGTDAGKSKSSAQLPPQNGALPRQKQLQTAGARDQSPRPSPASADAAAPPGALSAVSPGAAPAGTGQIGNGSAGTGPAGITLATTTATAATTEPVATANTEPMFVAQKLSPLQLEMLHGTLATLAEDQTVNRFEMPNGRLIANGEMLTITIDQLAGTSMEKTSAVKVAADGTIILPMLDPLSAVGITPAELEQRIAGKYHDLNLIPAATVTVKRTTAATQPTTIPTAALSIAATKPATRPISDTTVDVIVDIQRAGP